MAGAVTFWFELASRYTYPAAMRLETEARWREIPVLWRPFLLGPIFKAQGWESSPFVLYPAKGRYAVRDLERVCAAQSIPFRSSQLSKPQNSVLGARVATALEPQSRPAFARALFTLQFGEARDIGEPDIVAEALRRAGLDEIYLQRAQSDAVKAELRAATEEAMALGIFGAPSFTTSDGELFWGNDRLEQALDWARKERE